MPELELIKSISNRVDGALYKNPPGAIGFSVSVGAKRATYSDLNVVAVNNIGMVDLRTPKFIKAAQAFDTPFLFSQTLLDPNDVRLFKEDVDEVRSLFRSVVYCIKSEDCLREIENGEDVCIMYYSDVDPLSFSPYNIWLAPDDGPRKQWLRFCEFVVRGNIPRGILLPDHRRIAKSGCIVKRDLQLRKTTDGFGWREQTTAQNLIAHWIVIKDQMERISRARTQGSAVEVR